MDMNMNTDEPGSATRPFKYRCTSCSKGFNQELSLQDHILLKHTTGDQLKSYSCEKCVEMEKEPLQSFNTESHLTNHMLRVHGTRPLKCKVCFKTFNRLFYLRSHEQNHSQNHKCKFCCSTFVHIENLQIHLFKVHKKKSKGFKYLKCELCSLEFVSTTSLENHVVDKHVVDKEFPCLICSKLFIDQESLDKHAKQHDSRTQHVCDICSEPFVYKVSLIHHLGVEHKKFFYCDKCCRSFGSKSTFKQHSDPIGTTLKELILSEFKCKICGERFDSQCSLDIHANCHVKEIVFQKRGRKIIQNLTDSKITNPPKQKVSTKCNYEFKCDLCPLTFNLQGTYSAHRNLVHPKQLKCDFPQCSKSFKFATDLRRHNMTHFSDAVKQFVCEMCPKSFIVSSHLRVHVASKHGGPKPFKCSFKNCPTSWSTKTMLKQHLGTHQTEKLFKCDKCTEIYKYNSSLRRHQLKHHNTTSWNFYN